MRQLSGGYRRGGGVIGWSGPVALATAGGVRKRCRAAWSPRCVDGGSSCWSFDTARAKGYCMKARQLLSSDATVECTNVSKRFSMWFIMLFIWRETVYVMAFLIRWQVWNVSREKNNLANKKPLTSLISLFTLIFFFCLTNQLFIHSSFVVKYTLVSVIFRINLETF